MMKQAIKSVLLSCAAMLFVVSAAAQVTTSSMNGMVTEESGEPLVGAVVTAVHTPSGTQYYAVVNDKGQYHINGMRPGGPYTIEISFIGMNTEQHNNVNLILGESFELDAVLKSTNELESVVVVADRSFNASLTGAGAAFSTTPSTATTSACAHALRKMYARSSCRASSPRSPSARPGSSTAATSSTSTPPASS